MLGGERFGDILSLGYFFSARPQPFLRRELARYLRLPKKYVATPPPPPLAERTSSMFVAFIIVGLLSTSGALAMVGCTQRHQRPGYQQATIRTLMNVVRLSSKPHPALYLTVMTPRLGHALSPTELGPVLGMEALP